MSEEKKYNLKELQKELPEKQKIFCHEYVVDWNATRAYKKAYLLDDDKDNHAAVNGNKLLSNTKIKQYIDFVKNDYEFLCGISKTKQLKELYKIAYSTIAHLHNTWIELKEFEILTDDQKASIESIETKIEQRTIEQALTEIKYVKIKLYSKTTALDQINKMMGYNEPEKLNLLGGIQTLNLVKASESRGDGKD